MHATIATWPPRDTTNVTLNITPLTLKEVDERGQRVKLELAVMIMWQDERLIWTSHEAQVKSPLAPVNNVLAMSGKRVWQPQLAFTSGTNEVALDNNDMGTLEPVLRFSHLSCWPSGLIGPVIRYVDWTYCAFNSRHFPFEHVACQVVILTADNTVVLHAPPTNATTGYVSFKQDSISHIYKDMEAATGIQNVINIATTTPPTNIAKMFISSTSAQSIWRTSEWQLVTNVEGEPLLAYSNVQIAATSRISIEFQLVRFPLHQALVWIVIPGSLSLITSLTVVTVCDRGERYGFGSSIVLALVLMQVNVGDKLMPSENGGVPLISWYFVVQIYLVVASCVGTSIVEVWRKHHHITSSREEKVDKSASSTFVTIHLRLVAVVAAVYAITFTVFGLFWLLKI